MRLHDLVQSADDGLQGGWHSRVLRSDRATSISDCIGEQVRCPGLGPIVLLETGELGLLQLQAKPIVRLPIHLELTLPGLLPEGSLAIGVNDQVVVHAGEATGASELDQPGRCSGRGAGVGSDTATGSEPRQRSQQKQPKPSIYTHDCHLTGGKSARLTPARSGPAPEDTGYSLGSAH